MMITSRTRSRIRAGLIVAMITIITGAHGQCDDPHWTYYEANCYFINTQALNYSNAKAYCNLGNAGLADVQSSADNTFIKNVMIQLGNAGELWIGYTDIETEGRWVWDSTGQTGTYEDWAPGEPTNAEDEDCTAIDIAGWKDSSCSHRKASLCKKPHLKNVEFNCSSDLMVLNVRKDYWGLQSGDDLSLNDPACRPTEQVSTFHISWSPSRCGAMVMHFRDLTTYTNTLQMSSLGGAEVTRSRDRTLTVSCTFEGNGVPSAGFQPRLLQKAHTEQQLGQYTVRLDITDSSYSSPITDFPYQVQVQDRIYFHLSVQSAGRKDIFAVRCYATPGASAMSTPQYEFLQEDCPQDHTLFLNSSTSESLNFGMKAFQFLGNYSSAYVHCEVIVCSASRASRCSQGCLNRTGIKPLPIGDGLYFGRSSKHTLSQGPFTSQSSRKSGTKVPAISHILSYFLALGSSAILSFL